MKKIIEGRVYNTDTAELVGEWANTYNTRDFNFCIEKLYRKKTGEFFIHGRGGPMSRYAVSVGSNTMCGSEQIRPISFEYAKRWAEEHLTADEYEGLFGEVVEDDSRRVVAISLTVAAHGKLKRAAGEKGITVSALIEEYANSL
jgi:hypothetical protein